MSDSVVTTGSKLPHPHAMHIMPQKREEWFRLILFPFKAYIVVAFIMAMFFSRALRVDASIVYVLLGDAVSFVVLIFAATVEFIRGRRQSAMVNYLWACLAFAFGLLLLPFLAS